MYQRTRSSWTKHFDFLLLDLACLCISYLAAFAIRFKGGLSAFSDSYRNFLIVILIIEFASSLMCSNLAGVLKRGPFAELLHVASLSLISLMVTTLYMFSAHNSGAFSRLLVYYTFLLFLVLDFLLRLGYKRLVIVRLKKRAASGASPRSAFLVAEKSSADALIDDLKKDFYENFSLNGIVITDDAQPRPEYRGIPAYASLDDAAKAICRDWIDEVFVKVAATTPEMAKFTENCKEMGLVLHLVMNVKDAENSKQFVEDLGSNIVLTTAYNYMTPQQAFFKRSMDILGGLVGSVFTVLIGLVIGPIIYAKSPGPIFFKQTRIGKNGKKFNVIKFRSMYPDAEERKKEYLAQNRVSDGMMFKLDFDPRIIGNEILPDGTKKTGMQRGVVGAANLNQRLQEALNSSEECLRRSGTAFRLYDKVMQIKNNYEKEVFNGDIGRIVAVNMNDRELTVRFDDRDIIYDVTELDELVHVYATTIHKAQGSEYPIVVMPVLMTHYVMLQRNLIYTGITRAKKLIVIVGTKKALGYAVRNVTVTARNTKLCKRLV